MDTHVDKSRGHEQFDRTVFLPLLMYRVPYSLNLCTRSKRALAPPLLLSGPVDVLFSRLICIRSTPFRTAATLSGRGYHCAVASNVMETVRGGPVASGVACQYAPARIEEHVRALRRAESGHTSGWNI